MFKQVLATLLGALAFGVGFGESAEAQTVIFDFQFFDFSGGEIGTGFFEFDDITPDTQVAYDGLTNYSWEFDISTPAFDTTLSSSAGNIPFADDFQNNAIEGIQLSGAVGSRTLSFIDFDGQLLAFVENPTRPAGLGIVFSELSSSVQFRNYTDDGSSTILGSGNFTATERLVTPPTETIPTPALLPGLIGMGAAALRKRKQEVEMES
jgi:hypothetical protein